MKFYLRDWRKHRGLTCAELGELIGKSDDTVSRWERGVRDLNVSDLDTLAEALVCTPYDILFRDPSDEIDILKVWADATPEEKPTILKMLRGLSKDPEEKNNTTDVVEA